MKFAPLAGWTALALFLLPAWAVKSAPMQSRWLWVGVILFFAFLGAMSTVIKAIGPPQIEPPSAPTNPMLVQQAWVCGLSFLFAELSAIGFTYAEPGAGLLGSHGLLVSSLGANLFPVVAKYATAMQPPLSPPSLFRVQSIISIFLLAAIPCFMVSLWMTLTISDADWRKQFGSTRQKRPSDLFVMLVVPFCILAMATGLFGWFEFNEPTDADRMTTKKCIMQAICYARGDDLLIFVAGGMKVLTVFGFPLVAIAIVIANRVLAQTNETQNSKD
jgi:hypothetical protein